jgi:hypothetical protein
MREGDIYLVEIPVSGINIENSPQGGLCPP